MSPNRNDANDVAPAQGRDRVRAYTSQVRPHGGAHLDATLRECRPKDAAPDTRAHQQADKVQRKRDRQRQQARVAKAVTVRCRGVTHLSQRIVHLLA